MRLKGKTVLVTGASAGIGEACALAFAQEGARLILTARREERIKALAEKLNKEYGTETLTLTYDVRNIDEVKKAMDLPAEWSDIDVLINNAGLARGTEKIQDGVMQNWEEMIDTNVKGLLYMTRELLPRMTKRESGMIINIASIAGRQVYPGGNVYCASKAAVKAISEGIAIDTNGTNVKVCNIDPGLVETEFAKVRFHWDTEKADNVYKGFQPLTAADIADVALFAATRPAHVMIQDVLITPTAQANATTVHKVL